VNTGERAARSLRNPGVHWKGHLGEVDRIVAVKVSKTKFNERFEREAPAVTAT